MSEPDFQLDPNRIRHNFGRAAPRYERHDALHRAVQDELQGRLDFYLETPQRVLDIGSGTGRASAALKNRWPSAQVIAIDLAVPMLQQARRHSRWRRRFARVAANGAQLPLASKSIDVIHSNLCLHWCDDLQPMLREWVRVLRSGGYLALSTFGPDTLHELRSAWAQVDDQPHVSRFLDMHDLGDAIFAAGFKEPVLDVSRYTLTYDQPIDVLRELQGLGATNADQQRWRALTGKSRLQRMLQHYETLRCDGRIPATCEVVTVHAWGPVWRWRER